MNEAIKNIEIKKFDILRNTILSNEDLNGDYLSESFYQSNKVSEDKMKILKELDEKLLFLKVGSN